MIKLRKFDGAATRMAHKLIQRRCSDFYDGLVVSKFGIALLISSLFISIPESSLSAGENAAAFKPFTFGVCGDNRPVGAHPLTQPPVFFDIIKELNNSSAVFTVITGDLINGYVNDPKMIEKEWAVFKKACSKFKRPYYLVAGNHDIWNLTSRKIYEKLWGKLYYDFTVNGCEFIVLNTEEQDHPSKIVGAQLEWLKKRLEATKNLKYKFVFLHEPLWHETAESGWNEHVHPLLAKYKVDTVFAGHEHRFVDDGRLDGVRYIVTGGAGAELRGGRDIGAYYHFLLVKADNDKVSIRVVEPNSPAAKVPRKFAGDQLTELLDALDYKAPVIATDAPAEIALRPKLINPYDSPLVFRFKLLIPKDSGWSAPRIVMKETVNPGASKTVIIHLKYDGKKLFPLPKLTVALEINNFKIYERTNNIDVRYKRVLTIPKATGAIKIDGYLDEKDWKNAPSAGRWFNLTSKHWSEENVEFKALRDASHLYLSFKCHSDNPAALLGQRLRTRDWYVPWEDSVVIAFYSPKIADSKFVIGVSAHNIQSDYLASNKSVGFKWNKKWDSAVVRGKDGYALEIALPLSIFENKPLESIGLRINAGRMSLIKGRSLYCWSLPLGRISDPRGFGECVFPK